MEQIITLQLFAVEQHFLDINIGFGLIFCFDQQLFAILKIDGGRNNIGAADGITVIAGADRIEAKGAEDVPGGHLAGVIVTAEAVNTRCCNISSMIIRTRDWVFQG